jgi:hypothetical protein
VCEGDDFAGLGPVEEAGNAYVLGALLVVGELLLVVLVVSDGFAGVKTALQRLLRSPRGLLHGNQ